ncbi:exported hypothetical protein [Cupriavidus taiwanensis]|nr:exported hypothetical protein [Cupriavidus taiwanensis]
MRRPWQRCGRCRSGRRSSCHRRPSMLLCIPFCSFPVFVLSVFENKRVISNLAFPSIWQRQVPGSGADNLRKAEGFL